MNRRLLPPAGWLRWLPAAVAALLPTVAALAQGSRAALPPQTAAEAAKQTFTLWDQLVKGGWAMIPLGAMSVVAVLLICYFFLSVRRGSVASARFLNTCDARLRKRDYLGLLSDANRNSESLARVVQRTLDFSQKNQGAPLESVREIAESEGTRQAAALNQRVSYLADVGAIAPMVGLLGTVWGMIKAFSSLASDVAASKPLLLAEGVSEALICTCTGLLVGILAFVFYAVFRTRAARLTADLEASITHFLASFAASWPGARAAQPAAAGRREYRDPMMLEEDY